MPDNSRCETAREFLARRHAVRMATARVEIMRILGRQRPSAFMIDPRDGRPFLKLTAERTERCPA